MINNKINNLKELPKITDRISFLYLQCGRIEQDDFSVKYITETECVSIPCANINVLLLGPGITITHAAIVSISQCRCLCVWCGEGNSKFYAIGQPMTHSSEHLLLQAEKYCDLEKRTNIARKMYQKRFSPFNVEGQTIEQMRGAEGVRMKQVYKKLSQIYKVPWHGRNYKVNDYEYSDDINKAITYSNQILYAVVQSVIVALGFSPSIGFIYTGNVNSFVYDVADLYKSEISLPVAFITVQKIQSDNTKNLEKELRREMHYVIQKNNLLEHIITDLKDLFIEVNLK